MELELSKLSSSIIAEVIRFILAWLGSLSFAEVGLLLLVLVIIWFAKMMFVK